jgi:hypothetical protein
MNDAFSIIKDCLKTQENDLILSKLSPGKGYEVGTIVPILSEVFRGKDTNSVIKDLRHVYSIIAKVDKNPDIPEPELDHAIDFFSKIAEICLSNSAQQSQPEYFSL